MDPAYGSGSEIFGMSLVFVLGITILVLGVLVMTLTWWCNPAFFRSEGLKRGLQSDEMVTVDDALVLDPY
ncbi:MULTISPECIES: hypothetical protein [Corynebacterium]|uniref:hypothetical protein n=1 Tax=Corynebacterium TaxID=1716 RepID=UPI00124D3EB9|nr:MULTISPECIES: hypothetical protein [Corynebacterium]